jgi:hypothetical protein
MQIKLPFDSTKPIAGEATVELDKTINDVFSFIGKDFFENYPKWAVEVTYFEPLDGKEVFVGAKARQKRQDNGSEVESIFQITNYSPNMQLILKGINEPYQQSYMMKSEEGKHKTWLTFRFELLEIEVFMRPFQKLIRTAIEDGAENTVENIRQLIA